MADTIIDTPEKRALAILGKGAYESNRIIPDKRRGAVYGVICDWALVMYHPEWARRIWNEAVPEDMKGDLEKWANDMVEKLPL